MGRLTTHVLDTARGRPAAQLHIRLYAVTESGRELLGHFSTNDDGRVDTPLLEGAALQAGTYELLFEAGEYLQRTSGLSQSALFLDEIPIRFGIFHPDEHYHVPLLLSPYGYSTYRGS